MIKLSHLAVGLVSLTALASACQPKNMSKTDDKSSGSSMSADDMRKPLTEGTWVLTSLEGEAVYLDANQKQPTLSFSPDAQVTGYAGCNPLTGKYLLQDGLRLRISDVGVGLSMCENDKLERGLLSVLNSADNFTISGDQLMLTVGRRAPMATFTRRTEEGITNKYWKLVTLDGKAVTMQPNQSREQYFVLRGDGKITGFSGCNNFNGEYTVQPEQMRLDIKDNLASTRMACPDVTVDEQGMLQALSTADNYTLVKDKLSLNIGRRAPLAVFEAVYF